VRKNTSRFPFTGFSSPTSCDLRPEFIEIDYNLPGILSPGQRASIFPMIRSALLVAS
jgi:hypothetical protein